MISGEGIHPADILFSGTASNEIDRIVEPTNGCRKRRSPWPMPCLRQRAPGLIAFGGNFFSFWGGGGPKPPPKKKHVGLRDCLGTRFAVGLWSSPAMASPAPLCERSRDASAWGAMFWRMPLQAFTRRGLARAPCATIQE